MSRTKWRDYPATWDEIEGCVEDCPFRGVCVLFEGATPGMGGRSLGEAPCGQYVSPRWAAKAYFRIAYEGEAAYGD